MFGNYITQTLANFDWEFIRVTAAENCDIGWTSFGRLFNISATCEGRPARLFHSAVKAAVWVAVGTSPVTKSQKSDSGNGSPPATDEILRTWATILLLTSGSSWKNVLAFWNGHATESDTFFGVENWSFPDHTFDSTHTTIGHVDGNGTNLWNFM